MKLLTLILTLSSILYSCNDDTKFYSLSFKEGNLQAVSDSLRRFDVLFKKLDPMTDVNLKDSLIVSRIEPGLISLIYDGHSLTYNLTNSISWDKLSSSRETDHNISWLKSFPKKEKARFLSLIMFMVKNEISGVECCSTSGILTSYYFRGHPFADRHDLIIVFEDEFSKLSISERDVYLGNKLILDKKYGLILLVQDKKRFLRYVYGNDKEIPHSWLFPSERVFNIATKGK